MEAKKLSIHMEDVSPWSRLGFAKFQNNDSEEVLRLRDQVMEMSKVIADLSLRIEKLEREKEGPIDSVFSVLDHRDVYGEDFAFEEIILDKSDVKVVKSGFTAPPPEEIVEVENLAENEVEPIGGSENMSSDETVVQKEFDDDASITDKATYLVELTKKYILDNGAILNNQLSRKVYSEVDFEVTPKIKKAVKELIKEGEETCGFKSHKVDNFRVLYYLGDDPDEEYEKAFG